MSRIRYELAGSMAPHPMLERVGTMLSLSNHFQARAKKAGKNRDDHKDLADELTGDYSALVQSVRSQGVLEPIKICRIAEDYATPKPLSTRWWIADGRNRWLAAKEAGLKRLPIMRIATGDAPAIIAATVAARRHYTKGATAYLACLLHPELTAAGQGKRNDISTYALSAEVLASKFSISLRLLVQAIELFRLLEGEGKPFREDAEANIWAGCGLGAVKAGVDYLIANGKAAGGKPDPRALAAAAAWQNYRKASKAMGGLWKSWEHLEGEQLTTAMSGLKDMLSDAPLMAKTILGEALGDFWRQPLTKP